MTPQNSSGARVLVVEDDRSFADRVARNLALDKFEAEVVHDVPSALAALEGRAFDIVLADIKMPGKTGLDLLDDLRESSGEDGSGPPPPVIMLTSIRDVETAVDAMRRGAADYLTKEATREEIALRLRNALKQGKLAREVRTLRRTLDRYQDFEELVGVSERMNELRGQIEVAARGSVTVLVTGETGVGKELVARALHRASDRAAEAFVEVNCAALPEENLFLSELFGHERGAFTGALARKRGQFELADGGTLFLDEVGELGALAQARLLRAVETLTFTRLGGERPVKVNCRLIFATNKNLEEEAQAGRFRRDLLYRINVCPIWIPPLRSHPEDIPALARYFAAKMTAKHGLASIEYTPGALEALKANPWPGNVRELRNVVERLAIRFPGKAVEAANLRELNLSPGASSAASVAVLPEGGIQLEEVEKTLVMQALERSEWSQRRAADLLGISVDRMNARVKKFEITHPSWRVHKG